MLRLFRPECELGFHCVMLCAAPGNDKIPVFNQLGLGRRGNEVSPGVFYGSAAGKPAQRPAQLIRLLNGIQNDLASQSTPGRRYFMMNFD